MESDFSYLPRICNKSSILYVWKCKTSAERNRRILSMQDQVSFVNWVLYWPQLTVKPHTVACLLLLFPSGMRKRTGKTKAGKFVGWDEEINGGKRCRNKWCKGNCSVSFLSRPMLSQLWAVTTSHAKHSSLHDFYGWAKGFIAWSIPSVNSGLLSWLSFFTVCAHPQLPEWAEWEKDKFWCHQSTAQQQRKCCVLVIWDLVTNPKHINIWAAVRKTISITDRHSTLGYWNKKIMCAINYQ